MPKCANSSTKQTIRVYLRPDLFSLNKKKNIRPTIRKYGEPFVYEDKYQISKHSDYLTICIIRNPYERTISTWAHKITHNPKGKVQWPNLGFWAGMTFEEYVAHINKISDEKADIHFKSQAYLSSIGNELIPQYIFRFEDLPYCWKKIQYLVYSWCGMELPDMPHYNPSKEKRPDLDKMPRIKEVIYQRYKNDFKILGYNK